MNSATLSQAEQTLALGSQSFNRAAKLFDPETRSSVTLLYSWCRYCDDVIDNQVLGINHTTLVSEEILQQRLSDLYQKTLLAFKGEANNQAFAALATVVSRHSLSLNLAIAHLEGYRMDVTEKSYQTIDDTLNYCYHVAGVVGLMMAQIMGVQERTLLDRACDLGLAMQLTNIARDVITDAKMGRCYLPEQWLKEEGLNQSNFTQPALRRNLVRVVKRLLNLADRYYISAEQGYCALPLRSAWAIATAARVYRAIGKKILAAKDSAWDSRQATGRLHKLGLIILAAQDAYQSRYRLVSRRSPQLWHRPDDNECDSL